MNHLRARPDRLRKRVRLSYLCDCRQDRLVEVSIQHVRKNVVMHRHVQARYRTLDESVRLLRRKVHICSDDALHIIVLSQANPLATAPA